MAHRMWGSCGAHGFWTARLIFRSMLRLFGQRLRACDFPLDPLASGSSSVDLRALSRVGVLGCVMSGACRPGLNNNNTRCYAIVACISDG
jgi:hypothetical protein